MANVLTSAAIERNPAWVQLLGLCPLLAVTGSLTSALGLACASTLVVMGSNTMIAALRHQIPDFARLPLFVLIIATFTTIATLLLEAYAFEVYHQIALFVQIIVTNCMILGRAEAFASRQPVRRAFADACGTALGFAVALVAMGAVREVVGQGTLLAGSESLFGVDLSMRVAAEGWIPLARYAPGAFIVAGLLLAAGTAAARARNAGTEETLP